jgi:hypothetical protein
MGPNSKSGELTVKDVKAEDDGDYICRAKSQAGATDIVVNLDVVGKRIIIPNPNVNSHSL